MPFFREHLVTLDHARVHTPGVRFPVGFHLTGPNVGRILFATPIATRRDETDWDALVLRSPILCYWLTTCYLLGLAGMGWTGFRSQWTKVRGGSNPLARTEPTTGGLRSSATLARPRRDSDRTTHLVANRRRSAGAGPPELPPHQRRSAGATASNPVQSRRLFSARPLRSAASCG
jgi:hypothetical protein